MTILGSSFSLSTMLTLFLSSFHTANLREFLLQFDFFLDLNVSLEDVKLLYKSKKSLLTPLPQLGCVLVVLHC